MRRPILLVEGMPTSAGSGLHLSHQPIVQVPESELGGLEAECSAAMPISIKG